MDNLRENLQKEGFEVTRTIACLVLAQLLREEAPETRIKLVICDATVQLCQKSHRE
jgi:hypothetical protein